MQKQLKKDYMEMDNKKMKNSVYWITGLSGAGKTTVGKIFYTKLRNQKDSVLFLDGDRLRDVFGNDLGYTRKDRICCAMRYSKICQMLSEQGMDVVICTISMFHEIRAWNRENIVNYKEIYLEVPMKILKQRNQKDLYKSGNNVVGIDIELELPENPDITLINDGSLSPENLADILFRKIVRKE